MNAIRRKISTPSPKRWCGHFWVCLAWLATHPAWGMIALPLRSMLYVRQVDVPKLAAKYGSWDFHTKHELGVALLSWFLQAIRAYGVRAKVWLVVDGLYAARPFLLAVLAMEIVVIVRFEDGSWAPYFCTDTAAEVREILEAVAARWAIEEHFHDVKEVWAAGQQHVRNVWSNIGCWHLNQGVYTLVELCCWDQHQSELSDRSDRSRDNAERRPSHADRRRTIAREMLRKPILAALPRNLNSPYFKTLLEHVVTLAA
jgi:hypothetical protein